MSAARDFDVEADAIVPRRRSGVRKRTISIKRLSKRELARGEREYPAWESRAYGRPSTRAACLQGEHTERPCPYVSCKHHLYLDVNARTGSITLNFPDREVWELEGTCALDIADRGGMTFEEVGEILNLTREAIRQIENKAYPKIANEMAEYELTAADFIDAKPVKGRDEPEGGLTLDDVEAEFGEVLSGAEPWEPTEP